ncbi:MAG: signal peptidase I [Oscillospiraceae bacterium]|nr:signal peptidase I [Oscillospiraceae bacterium]
MEPFEEEKQVTAEAVQEAAETVQEAEEATQEAAEAVQEAAEAVQETAEAAQNTAAAAGEAQPEAEAAKEKDGGLLGDLMDLIESVVVSVFVVMLVFTFLVCTADVEGSSMEPTLLENNRLLVNRIDKHYKRGDILILDSDKARIPEPDGTIYEKKGLEKRIVKRLIAQGGQQIDIDFDEGIVRVDGEVLDEPYISAPTMRDIGGFTYPITIPEGYVFVMGDNRPVSNDSRSDMIGLVPVENIIGKVIIRISPLSDFGKVE